MAKAAILQLLKAKELDVTGALKRILKDPGQVPELVEALQLEKNAAKYACEKVLRLAGEQRPGLIYLHFDAFAALLGCENNFLKWGAIMTIANLTPVDTQAKFEAIFERYYAPVAGPTMITAANIVSSSPRIAWAKPHLAQRITREILRVEKARYEHHGEPSPECRNVAVGHAIDAFSEFFDLIDDKAAVLAFVRRQLTNLRKPVVKKAERFLRKHERADKSTRTRRG